MRIMIYDCFSFFNELDILEMRLNILYNYVDYFVITEANKTHTGVKIRNIFLSKIKIDLVSFWIKLCT